MAKENKVISDALSGWHKTVRKEKNELQARRDALKETVRKEKLNTDAKQAEVESLNQKIAELTELNDWLIAKASDV